MVVCIISFLIYLAQVATLFIDFYSKKEDCDDEPKTIQQV